MRQIRSMAGFTRIRWSNVRHNACCLFKPFGSRTRKLSVEVGFVPSADRYADINTVLRWTCIVRKVTPTNAFEIGPGPGSGSHLVIEGGYSYTKDNV